MRQTFRTIVGLLSLSLACAARAQVIDVGTRLEMFVDCELIASTARRRRAATESADEA